MWIIGVFVRERVALIQQRAGEVQLAAVDSKGAVSVPGRIVEIMGKDVTMKVTEDVFMHARAGFADGGGDNRLRLRSGHAETLALFPELSDDGCVAMTSAGENETDDQEHDDQGGECSVSLDPGGIMVMGHACRGIYHAGPHGGDVRIFLQQCAFCVLTVAR